METVELEEWDKARVQKETNMETLKLHGVGKHTRVKQEGCRYVYSKI